MTTTVTQAETTALRLAMPDGMAVREFRSALSAIEGVYNGLVAIDGLTQSADSQRQRFGEQPILLADLPSLLVSPSFDSFLLIPPTGRLVRGSASFSSPGWVEVIGALNPLTQIREYLKDRHERKKDKDYRNEAEKKRLQLENELLANKVINDGRLAATAVIIAASAVCATCGVIRLGRSWPQWRQL